MIELTGGLAGEGKVEGGCTASDGDKTRVEKIVIEGSLDSYSSIY
jgi:hypothetical protein